MNLYTIGSPCHQNWNNMTPDDKGRFCAVCKKSVHDLTHKTQEEIGTLYHEADGKLCGRMPLQLPPGLHYQTGLRAQPQNENRWSQALWKTLTRVQRFAIALLVAAGILKFDLLKGEIRGCWGTANTYRDPTETFRTPKILPLFFSNENGAILKNTKVWKQENWEWKEYKSDENGYLWIDVSSPGTWRFCTGVYGTVYFEVGVSAASENEILVISSDHKQRFFSQFHSGSNYLSPIQLSVKDYTLLTEPPVHETVTELFPLMDNEYSKLWFSPTHLFDMKNVVMGNISAPGADGCIRKENEADVSQTILSKSAPSREMQISTLSVPDKPIGPPPPFRMDIFPDVTKGPVRLTLTSLDVSIQVKLLLMQGEETIFEMVSSPEDTGNMVKEYDLSGKPDGSYLLIAEQGEQRRVKKISKFTPKQVEQAEYSPFA